MFFSGFRCKEVYISKIKGRDSGNCGDNFENQCSTLQYAVSNIAKDGDTLFLYGGHKSRVTYRLRSPLLINVSLVIKKQLDSSITPIITTEFDSLTNPFVFEHTSEKKLTLEINSIEFQNTYFGNGNGTLIINNCTINNFGINTKDPPSSENSVFFSLTRLQIINTNITCNNRYLVSDKLQGIDEIGHVTIKGSVLTGCSIFLNSTLNYTTPLRLDIEDTIFQGNVDIPVAYINRYSNTTLHNIIFTNNNGVGDHKGLFHATIPFSPTRKSSISFQNITFQNNQHARFLFRTLNTDVHGTLMVHRNNTSSYGTALINATGTIGEITFTGNTDFGFCIATDYCNYTFGKITINNNQLVRNALITFNADVTIDSMVLRDIVLAHGQVAVSFIKSHVNVISLDLKNATVPSASAVSLRRSSVAIGSLIMKDSLIYQTLLQIGGSLLMMSGIIHNNNNTKTAVGSIHAELFDVRAMSITNNLIGGNFFHIENVFKVDFRQIYVSNNSMDQIFHLLECNLFIDGVIIKNNIASKHGKALSFTDEAEKSIRTNYNVTIKNFHADFKGFIGRYESNNYFEIEMRTSNLNIQNSSISIQDVYVPSIKVMRLVFAAKHPNVHPEISVLCPTNYDIVAIPLEKAASIDYAVDCQRCEKDTYSLLRGQLKLKGKIILQYYTFKITKN